MVMKIRDIRPEILELYQDFSFDNFECDEEDLKKIVTRAKSFAKDPHGFLLMQGRPGTGKTHLAVSILKETSLSFNYVTHSGLIQEYRKFHYQKSDPETEEEKKSAIYVTGIEHLSRYETLQDSPLLCIDEFGFVNHSQDEVITTFTILDYRFQKLLPTILLTNYTTEQLEEIIDPRLLDRIEQALYATLLLGFTSKRKSMNSQYLEKASK